MRTTYLTDHLSCCFLYVILYPYPYPYPYPSGLEHSVLVYEPRSVAGLRAVSHIVCTVPVFAVSTRSTAWVDRPIRRLGAISDPLKLTQRRCGGGTPDLVWQWDSSGSDEDGTLRVYSCNNRRSVAWRSPGLKRVRVPCSVVRRWDVCVAPTAKLVFVGIACWLVG